MGTVLFSNMGTAINRTVPFTITTITGALKDFGRDEARNLVESLGGMTTSSISKKIDYVVVGEDPGSKYDKAKELGIKTLTEEEFKKMIG